MNKIPVSDIVDGLLLAADVMDSSGNTLLGKGTVLGAKHREMLSRRGIETVSVIQPEAAAAAEAKAEAKDVLNEQADNKENEKVCQKIEAIEHAFSTVLENENMRELHRLAIKWAQKGVLRD